MAYGNQNIDAEAATARYTASLCFVANANSPAKPYRVRLPDAKVVTLFGVEIADQSLRSAVRWLCERARHKITTRVAFLNAHCVNTLFQESAYRVALTTFDRVFGDGAGVRMAARSHGIRLKDNVNGTDLFPLLCAEAAKRKLGLYLLGGTGNVAESAGQKMAETCPGLIINGARGGYFQSAEDEQVAIAHINESGAQILLVGLGVPTQEIWIAKHRHALKTPVILGVGGLFDYYSGRIQRAPSLWRKCGIEWLWRLLMEPRRLARRYVVGNVVYLARLAILRMNGPQESS
jgi:exopolysaccharide biosynthesis WecB/TagA/CpsF family protein